MKRCTEEKILKDFYVFYQIDALIVKTGMNSWYRIYIYMMQTEYFPPFRCGSIKKKPAFGLLLCLIRKTWLSL